MILADVPPLGSGDLGLLLSMVLAILLGLLKHDASKLISRLDRAEEKLQQHETDLARAKAVSEAERVAERVEKLERAVSGIESNVAVIRAWVDQQANPEHRHRRFTDQDARKEG